MGFFDKLKQGLAKTKQVFSFTKVDENLLDELDHRKTYKVMWEYDNKGYIENIDIYNK